LAALHPCKALLLTQLQQPPHSSRQWEHCRHHVQATLPFLTGEAFGQYLKGPAAAAGMHWHDQMPKLVLDNLTKVYCWVLSAS
jgi:hypothetical protein